MEPYGTKKNYIKPKQQQIKIPEIPTYYPLHRSTPPYFLEMNFDKFSEDNKKFVDGCKERGLELQLPFVDLLIRKLQLDDDHYVGIDCSIAEWRYPLGPKNFILYLYDVKHNSYDIRLFYIHTTINNSPAGRMSTEPISIEKALELRNKAGEE